MTRNDLPRCPHDVEPGTRVVNVREDRDSLRVGTVIWNDYKMNTGAVLYVEYDVTDEARARGIGGASGSAHAGDLRLVDEPKRRVFRCPSCSYQHQSLEAVPHGHRCDACRGRDADPTARYTKDANDNEHLFKNLSSYEWDVYQKQRGPDPPLTGETGIFFELMERIADERAQKMKLKEALHAVQERLKSVTGLDVIEAALGRDY